MNVVEASPAEAGRTSASATAGRKLPKRDYLLLPLVALLTVGCLFAAAEMMARLEFPDDVPDTCFIWTATGPHDRPNCTSYERVPESPLIKNVFNECGYRSLSACASPTPGTTRILVMGSSMAEGLLVPMDRTYLVLAQRRLRDKWHRNVEFENLAEPLESPLHIYQRVDEALALKPSAVLIALTPIDIESLPYFMEGARMHVPATAPPQKAKPEPVRWNNLYKRTQEWLLNTRTMLAVEHLLFRQQDTFLRLYLLYGDKADFLRPPFTSAWQNRFHDLDYVLGRAIERFRSAGVPVLVTAIPSRADAALLSTPRAYPGTNPYAWADEVAKIAQRHGASYADLLPAFRAIPRSDLLYYVVDGHMGEAGQPVLGKELSDALVTHGLLK